MCEKIVLKKHKPTPKANFKTSLPCETNTLLHYSLLGNEQSQLMLPFSLSVVWDKYTTLYSSYFWSPDHPEHVPCWSYPEYPTCTSISPTGDQS